VNASGSAGALAAARRALNRTASTPLAYPEGWENHPVRWVSRTDAEAYCSYHLRHISNTLIGTLG
jgi:hypothetical protein